MKAKSTLQLILILFLAISCVQEEDLINSVKTSNQNNSGHNSHDAFYTLVDKYFGNNKTFNQQLNLIGKQEYQRTGKVNYSKDEFNEIILSLFHQVGASDKELKTLTDIQSGQFM